MSIIDERRVGVFSIDKRLVDTEPDTCMAVLSDCVVVRAEFLYHTGAIEYVAFHESFDPVEIGMMTPRYVAHVKCDYDPETQTITTAFAGFCKVE